MSIGKTNRPYVAAASMLTAMAVLGFIDNFIRHISDQMGIWQFLVMRGTMMVPVLLAMSLAGLGLLWPRRPGPVLARGAVVSAAMVFYFGSLGFMPVAEALAGLFTSPIFVMLINALVMKQHIGPRRILAAIVGFAGVLLVLQPGAAGFSPVLLMPLAAGLLNAIGALATRSWCAGESALSLVAVNMLILGVIGLLAVLVATSFGGGEGYLTRGWAWPVTPALPWVALQAVGSLAGIFLIARAYQLDEPSYVAVFEYSVMIFAPAFSFLLFAQTLNMLQLFGVALIIGAGVIIALRSGQ